MESKLSKFKPCMLYISRSSSMLESKIDDIKNYLKDRINIESDFNIFHGNEGIDTRQLSNYLNTPSFFSDRKFAVIKNIEKLSLSHIRSITGLLAEVDSQNFYSILIMTSLKKKLDSDFLAKVKKIGVIAQLNNPNTDSLKKWLEERSELDRIRFTQNASTKLIENVNFNLKLLRDEYEKLYTYVLDKKDKVIDEKTIDGLVNRVYEMKIFDFVDFTGNRDKNEALKALKAIMIEKQRVIGLISLLFRMFKFMLYLKSTSKESSGNNVEDKNYINPNQNQKAKSFISTQLGHTPYLIGRVTANYSRFARKYSSGEIIKIIDLLNNYDILLRTNEVSEYKLVLKMLNEIVEMKTD